MVTLRLVNLNFMVAMSGVINQHSVVILVVDQNMMVELNIMVTLELAIHQHPVIVLVVDQNMVVDLN